MCTGYHCGTERHGDKPEYAARGKCYCGCGHARRFLSRNEKIEMLEQYRTSLKNELDGVEEELRVLTTGT